MTLIIEITTRVKTDMYGIPEITKFFEGISTNNMQVKVTNSKIVSQEDKPMKAEPVPPKPEPKEEKEKDSWL